MIFKSVTSKSTYDIYDIYNMLGISQTLSGPFIGRFEYAKQSADFKFTIEKTVYIHNEILKFTLEMKGEVFHQRILRWLGMHLEIPRYHMQHLS